MKRTIGYDSMIAIYTRSEQKGKKECVNPVVKERSNPGETMKNEVIKDVLSKESEIHDDRKELAGLKREQQSAAPDSIQGGTINNSEKGTEPSKEEIDKIIKHVAFPKSISVETVPDGVLIYYSESWWSSIDTESWDHFYVALATRVTVQDSSNKGEKINISFEEELRKYPFNEFCEKWIKRWGIDSQYIYNLPDCEDTFYIIKASADTIDKYM